MARNRPHTPAPQALGITRAALADLGLKSLEYLGRDPVLLVDVADLSGREAVTDDFVDLAVPQADQVLREALEGAGIEHVTTLGAEIDMSLYAEVDDQGQRCLWVLFHVPPRGHQDLSGDLVDILSGLFFDDDLNVDWFCTVHPARPAGLGSRERVMCWRRP